MHADLTKEDIDKKKALIKVLQAEIDGVTQASSDAVSWLYKTMRKEVKALEDRIACETDIIEGWELNNRPKIEPISTVSMMDKVLDRIKSVFVKKVSS